MAGIFDGYVEFLSASSSAFPNEMTAKGYGTFLLGINKTLEGLRDLPVQENTDIIEKRYKELGGTIQVLRKAGVGHHPHSLPNPEPIVDFILSHAK